uniref:pyridoxal 5'-phosphate synthase n=1 Tax=Macrostomum lignano TaxID=282301 RepID=A0A1I8FHL8_9PLAT
MGSPNEPNQMALATATRDGRPSLRYLLLKGHDETGFYFYTNYNSRKGKELADNRGPPCACTGRRCTAWLPSRVTLPRWTLSAATPTSNRARWTAKSAPRSARRAASLLARKSWNRARRSLSERVTAEGAECIDRPEQWGGYRLRPDRFEFWQGQRDRLHDRLQFRRQADGAGWTYERLAP